MTVAKAVRPRAETILDGADLHGSLQDPELTSMTFLNEVAQRYPAAISFAAGRPYEDFLDIDDVHRHLRTFCRHLEEDGGNSPDQVRRILLQYGRTKGIINDLVAHNLKVDEAIEVDPEAVVVTVGCQEAMFLVLRALRSGPADALLAVSPTYVGLTGAARLVDMPVLKVDGGTTGVDCADLRDQLDRARKAGLRPRACYLMPDFANPSGATMDLVTREELLRIAVEEDILLLEDNPYGLFHGDDVRLPTLKTLDRHHRVIYLGSFAKSVMPGARIGFVVADQTVSHRSGDRSLLADELTKIKSMLTLNTSPIAQAVVGGRLLECAGNLYSSTGPARAIYQRNLRLARQGLERRFPAEGPTGVRWNAPTGGFFIVVSLPFPADDDLLEESARTHGVLWTPMHHFYGDGGGTHELRLSTSLLTPAEIESGLDRFAALVHGRVSGGHGGFSLASSAG